MSFINININNINRHSAGVAAKAAESRKHEQNDTKCSELGWQCIPLAVETYGAWGEEVCNAFSCIAMRKAILTNCSKSQVLGDLYGRLSIVLVRANARAILARWQTCRSMQWTTDLSVCICVFIEYYEYETFNIKHKMIFNFNKICNLKIN